MVMILKFLREIDLSIFSYDPFFSSRLKVRRVAKEKARERVKERDPLSLKVSLQRR